MNDPARSPEDPMAHATREEIMSALFANMVIQQTKMAMMLLGKMPHPETGELIHDLEAAQMFIDQLEMLEAKTKGNLSKQEEALLKQGLTTLRMSFVEAIDQSGAAAQAPSQPQPQPAPSAPRPAPSEPAAAAPKSPEPPPAEPAPEESRKKFSKKY
jgi:Domain of unknown function (DUF1844)